MYICKILIIEMKLNGLSLFASAGIAEMNLSQCNINIKIANELIPIRAKVHKFWHPNADIICGDITDKKIKEEILNKSLKENIDFILATPPCQGVSLIGKNKTNDDMISDPRNFLIFEVFEIMEKIVPKVIIIENVDRFLKMLFPHKGQMLKIEDIIKEKYQKTYNICTSIYNCADYGVPQNRNRAIIVMCKKDSEYTFSKPIINNSRVSVFDAIGDLPSLESGQKSNIKNHNARVHTDDHIHFMKHTPTGKSAFENKVHFPKKKNGEKLKGYRATYKRMEWDKPAPTITMRNDAISSQSNVHPGRLLPDGTYSDARVLTLRELFILSSIKPDIDIPEFASDIQIRHMIGEAVPPLLMEVICKNIIHNTL